MTKEALELRKLEAEVGKLEAEIGASRRGRWLEQIKVYSAYLTVLVSLVAVTISFLQYLAHQERERKFQVSQQLLTLIGQLDNAKPEPIQRNAALTLRYFGWQGAPIVIENLAVDRKPEVYKTLVGSLEAIVGSTERAEDVSFVVETMCESAQSFLAQEMREEHPRTHMLQAHVQALGAAAVRAKQREMLPDKLRQRTDRILGDVKERIPEIAKGATEAAPARLKSLEATIEAYRTRLAS